MTDIEPTSSTEGTITEPVSIGRDKAIALAEAEHWKDMTMRQRAEFQFSVRELTMPFEVFHEAVEKTLGRPVWTHELAMDYKGLRAELLGERPAPSFEEIMNLIPEDKRVVIGL